MTTCASGEELAEVKLKDQLFIDAQCPEEIQKGLINSNSDCSSSNISYVKYLQSAIENLNVKFEALTRDMHFIREENNALKNEVSILRKELENANSAGPLNFLQLKIDGEDERRLSKLADAIFLGKLTKYQQQVYSELGPEEEGNKNLKSILSSVRCRYLWYIFIMVLVLIGAAVALILLLPTQNDEDDMLSSNFTDRLITRGYWLALPERGTVNKFELPVHIVMVGHTSNSMCSLTAACSSLVRTIQADAFSRGWSDIAYNFLVGGDGNIYEGRGWDKIAAHTLRYNNISLGVAFMGNFARDLPPKKQLSAFAILLSEGVKLEWDSEMSANSSLLLYSREEWQAQPSRGKVKPLKEDPPHYVIIAHTAGGNCTSFNTCSQKVRDIQYDHMGRGWDDLGMHFLVGGDGAAYTGLGWGKYGSHTIPFNRRSIAIYFIGNFMFVLPPKRQIRAAKLLIEEGVRLGKIASDYKLFAHKQVWATESPGAKLIEDMKKWPHWTSYEKSDELKI